MTPLLVPTSVRSAPAAPLPGGAPLRAGACAHERPHARRGLRADPRAPRRRARRRPEAIARETRFKEDLEADSLDLYTLVQELEDTYGVSMSDEQAAQILTVGAGRRLRARPRGRPMRAHDAARRAARRAARGPRAPGLHARLLERAPQRLLRAPRVPRRQRARAGGDRPPVPAAGGRALRRRAADEDPRAGRVGAVVPRASPSASRCPSACARRRPTGCATAPPRSSRPSACWRR